MNIDGSFDPNTNKGGTGCVIRDSEVAYTELSALIHGLRLGLAQNFMDINIAMDSTEGVGPADEGANDPA
ncbi:hypothetical protein KY285_020892 [Solanum tuberosum]|nr:hypothetical protein KY285_020892 [Solanum tuberosum]